MRAPLALAVVIAGIALAACGGGSSSSETADDEYAPQVRAILSAFIAAGSAGLEQQGSPKGVRAAGVRLIALGAVGDEAAEDLRALRPRPSARGAHDQLIGAFADYSSEVSQVGGAISFSGLSLGQAQA